MDSLIMKRPGNFRVLFLHDSLVVNARSAQQIHGSILYEGFKMSLLKLTANSLYSVFWPKTFVSILFTYFILKVSFLQPLNDVYFVTYQYFFKKLHYFGFLKLNPFILKLVHIK
jgi:hypothetical protein